MADLDVLTIAAGAGDTIKTALEKLDENQKTEIQNHFLDSSEPGTIVNGMIWIDNTDTTKYVVKLREDGAWVVLTDKIAEGNRDFNQKQAVNFRFEHLATGSLTAAAAGSESQAEWDSTLEKLCLINSTSRDYVAVCDIAATTKMEIPLRMTTAAVGTAGTASTATEWGGYLLDAVAEEVSFVAMAPIPNGWTAANDLTLKVWCLLANGETANDTIDLDGVWQSGTPCSGDGTGKTETAFTAESHDIGAHNAQYDFHEVELTVDYDDADNPVAAGDWFKATIHHDPTEGTDPVAGIIVVGGTLSVPVFNYSG